MDDRVVCILLYVATYADDGGLVSRESMAMSIFMFL